MSDSLRTRGLQHARLPCPSLTPGACSSSCPLSWWCHPTISSSVSPLSFRLQCFPASGFSDESGLFAWGGQSIGASISVLPMNIQGWFSFGMDWLPWGESSQLVDAMGSWFMISWGHWAFAEDICVPDTVLRVLHTCVIYVYTSTHTYTRMSWPCLEYGKCSEN